MKKERTYYNIGFDEDEIKQLAMCITQWEGPPYFLSENQKSTRRLFIKHVALTVAEVKQENKRLKNILTSRTENEEAARAASGAARQSQTTWTGYFRGIEKAGNVIYPVWG